jgi:hypothetical protein
LIVTHLKWCWLGVARVRVGRTLRFVKDRLGNPDAIEIVSNSVKGNLVCMRNRPHVWDSVELNPGHLFPRALERNKVRGKRRGQCVRSRH